MSPDEILGIFNYGLVLLYGLFLTISISGGWTSRRAKILVWSMCLVFMLFQIICWLLFGVDGAKRLYPLIVHLPLFLILVFGLKRHAGIALVSICTAYLCCQLPRCGDILVAGATGSLLAGEIAYTIIIFPIFALLQRYFSPAARSIMEESWQSLLLFGSLPVVFYIFTYTTTIYSNVFYSGSEVVAEVLPTVLGLFYMVFATAYRFQLQARTQAELQGSQMASQLRQAESDLVSLRNAEAQSAAYQHDMRHHLATISAFLAADKPQRAKEYINQVQADIEAITPKRFCENELVNLLCSSYSAKAEHIGARLTVNASIPSGLSISDTELCAILSNGLENALNAVEELEEDCRWVELYCVVRLDKLLIQIKNPYAGQIRLQDDGLPESGRPGHGHGCRSIYIITRQSRGLCSFEPKNGVFTLRVALPM